ncbi:hypothetical protein BJ741DRAFT_649608 [Chytriomyces cf. hyalinus JEL632]|nr:hypothetical protein BJ741DRAFT_649608 [Chytriomyces cf. hyalinus JEL632]
MPALSSYSSVCIFMTAFTFLHLAGFIVFIIWFQEHPERSKQRRLPAFATPFNMNIAVILVSLLLIYSCETGIGIASDHNADTETLEDVLITGRTVGFIAAEIGYINYSNDRAKSIFETTLTPVFGKGLHWAVKTVPLLFLPTVLFRAAFVFVSRNNEAASIFSISRWYGAATAIVTVLLDTVFLVSFVLFLRANSPSETVHPVSDNSMLIIARYGAAGSFIFLGAAGTLSAYAEQVNASLRLLSYIFLSAVSVILTCLKWQLHCERVARKSAADERLRGILGSAELRRIRSREMFPEPVVELPKGNLESGFVDANTTVKNLEGVKDLCVETDS